MPAKRKIKMKTIAFLTIVPVLLLTSIFQIKCPVCNGTGHISATPGVENLEITNSSSEETYISRNFCEMYIIYKYTVVLSIRNNGTEKAEGWVKLILREFGKGRVMDVKYVLVSVSGLSEVDAQYEVWFQSGLDAADQTEVHPELTLAGIPCSMCRSTGKVSLNLWLLSNKLKETLRETARVSRPYSPPIYMPPEASGSFTEGG